MAYTWLFQKEDTVANFNGITTGTGAITLTTGNFSVSGTQPYVLDGDTANAEVVTATVSGTTFTLVARGLDNTSAVTHTAGCKVGMYAVPSHYANGLGAIAANDAWTAWTPSYGAGGSMTYGTVTTNSARYMQLGKTVFFAINATGTTGGSASDRLTFTAPVARTASTSYIAAGNGEVIDGGLGLNGRALWNDTSTTVIAVLKYDGSNFGLGATRQFRIVGHYEV